jgi:hypothetical protein
MRQTNTRTVAEQKPLGVIDVVSAGLSLVWRRPWTLLVPVLLDTLIWLLPRLSLTQIFLPLQSMMLSTLPLSGDPASQETLESVQRAIESVHLLGLVSAALNAITRMPTLLAINLTGVTSPIAAWDSSIAIQSPELLALLFVPLFVLGLLAVAFYLEWIAQGVRPLEASAPRATLVRVAKLWLNLIWFTALILALLIVAAFATLAVRILFNSPELGAFVTLLAGVGLFWLLIYFFFVPSIMGVSTVGFGDAMRRSTLLFRLFFLQTLALVALSVFLDQGLTIIWTGLTVSSFGTIIAILANAFIGTSLIAASMVYYQDRMNLLERIRSQLKAKPK